MTLIQFNIHEKNNDITIIEQHILYNIAPKWNARDF